MNKRYCIFSTIYLPGDGEVERYTYNMARKLVEYGEKVTIVTSNLYDLPMHEIKDEIEIYRVPCIPFMNGRFPILLYNSNLRKIRKNLENKHFDMVIVNERTSLHSLFGVKFANENDIKCITIEHKVEHTEFTNRVLNTFAHFYEHKLTSAIKKNCRYFYGVSYACNRFLRHFEIKAKGVLYNGVDLNQIESYLERPVVPYRQKYNIKEEDIVISYVGSLEREEGIPQLINAVRNIKANNKIWLILAGDGSLNGFVQDNFAINKQIILLNNFDYANVIAVLKASDIFCIPSESERLPVSVLDAAAAKCFIIINKKSGANELIKSDELGLIIPDNKSTTLERNIKLALADKNYRLHAAQKTYKELKNGFTIDETVDKIIRLERELR